MSEIIEKLEIEGEEFGLEYDDAIEQFFITHPRWSLVGMGSTYLLARADLIKGIYLVSELYFEKDRSEMSIEAYRMTKFMRRVMKAPRSRLLNQ